MRKSAKRFLSTILALTMLCSCMVVMNISTVFAAAGDSWSVTADDFYSGQSTSSSSKVSPTNLSVTADDGVSTIALSSGTNYYESIGDYCTLTNSDDYTSKGWSTHIRIGGDRTFTITPAADGYITFYWYDNGGKSVKVGSNETVDATNATITSGTAVCKANTTFTITLTGNNICMLGIEYEYAELTEYTWTLDTSALTISLAGTLALGNTTTYQLTNSLSYDGTDYVLNSDYATLADDEISVNGTDVTVTPQDSWFTEARKNITDSAYFNASDLTGNLAHGSVFGTYFEFYASNSGNTNTATRETANFESYGNLNYGYRLKLGGTNRNIKFTLTDDALVQIVFASNDDSESRNCCISTTASGTAVTSLSTPSTNAMNAPTVLTCTLEGTSEGTDYYIYTTSGGINIYSINIVQGADYADATDSIYGGVGAYANGDNSYILSTVGDISGSTALTITNSNGDAIDKAEDSVYEYVCVDNFVFAASDIDADNTYIYGTQLIDTTGDDPCSKIVSNVVAELS